MLAATLVFDILLQHRQGCSPDRPGEVAWRPQDTSAFPHRPERQDFGKFLLEAAAGNAFQAVDQFRQADLRRIVDEQVNVIALAVELLQLHLEIGTDALENLLETGEMLCRQDPPPPLRGEHEVSVQAKDNVVTGSDVHRPN